MIYLKENTRNLSELGDILNLRMKANLTQENVAKHCGVSLQAYQRWEHGVGKYIDESKFDKLKEILNA